MDFAIALVGLAVIGGVGLIVYMIRSPAKPHEPTGQRSIAEEEKIRIEGELFSCKDERDRLKAERESLASALQEIKKEDSELRDQISRLKEWYGKNQEALEKVKKENLDLKDKLVSQEKGITEHITHVGNLNKELKEAKGKIDYLEKENKELLQKIKAPGQGETLPKPQAPAAASPTHEPRAKEDKKPESDEAPPTAPERKEINIKPQPTPPAPIPPAAPHPKEEKKSETPDKPKNPEE
ncbi:MAG: hypothetical protein ABH865_02175 [Candidatus Omnitrophota bacterium]